MGSIYEDLDEGAAWISAAMRSDGFRTDFRPPSLWEVDRFYDANMLGPRQARPDGRFAQDVGSRLWSVGAYVGEVVARSTGARWRSVGEGEHDELAVELHLPDGRVIWPVQRAVKRFANGPEDSIGAYGLALGLPVGPPPAPPRPTGRRRLFGR